MRTTTSSLGLTTTHIPISGVANGVIAVVPVPIAALAEDIKEKSKPIARPVAIAPEPITKWRREVFVVVVMFFPLCLACSVNSCAHLLEGAATANIGD